MTLKSGMPGSAGAAGWTCNSPNLRAKSRCCSCERCWSRKKMTRFSASARWISSICRLLGARRSTPPISLPIIGGSLPKVIDSYGESSGVYLMGGRLRLLSELSIASLREALFAENPAKDRVDVVEVIAGIEGGVDLFGCQIAADFGIRLEQISEMAAAVP